MNECLLCGRKLKQDMTFDFLFSFRPLEQSVVCKACCQKFEKIDFKASCPGCGRQMSEKTICEDCNRWEKAGYELLFNQALYKYDENMKAYITRYKFMGDYRYRLIFANEFQEKVTEFQKQGYAIVPIPVDRETFEKTRGFNQVLGWLGKIDCENYLVMRQNKGRLKQSHKDRAMRMKTKQPFEYVGPNNLSDKKILLVDDIYTTGRTLYHAKALLEDAGAKFVTSVTLAR